jgi:hypothetical protein
MRQPRARACAWLLLSCACVAGAPAGAKWRRARVDWDAVERELEVGDDPALAVSEDALAIADMERRRALAPEPGVAAAHAAAQAGPTMLFAGLRAGAGAGAGGGGGDALANAWRELLHTAGIDVAVYDVAPRRLLVALQRGWRGAEVRDFLLAQPEVADVEWDGEVVAAEPALESKRKKGGRKARRPPPA